MTLTYSDQVYALKHVLIEHVQMFLHAANQCPYPTTDHPGCINIREKRGVVSNVIQGLTPHRHRQTATESSIRASQDEHLHHDLGTILSQPVLWPERKLRYTTWVNERSQPDM